MAEDVLDEPKRATPIFDEADIVVIGGGAAGVAAAVSAARSGGDVLLIERYGYLGGMATGGNVILLTCYGPPGRIVSRGIPLEFWDRLQKMGAAREREGKVDCFFHPEFFKLLCNDMLRESGARMLLHCWCVGATMQDGRVDAVIFESKSGRLAVRGRIFIDCSGDADLAEWADVPHERSVLSLGLIMKLGGVNGKKFERFKEASPKDWNRLREENARAGGIGVPNIAWAHDVAWVNNHVPGDALDVRDLTRAEIEVRTMLMKTYEFYRRHVPGFEGAFIIDVAPQIGTRESRRITGEYVLSEQDILLGRGFDDAVGKTGNWLRAGSVYSIPYRCLLPQGVDNVIFAGRCISTTHEAHNVTRVIVPCMLCGQAAGIAAALAVASDSSPKEIDVQVLREKLSEQGVLV